jgi:ankyrin repeat protein
MSHKFNGVNLEALNKGFLDAVAQKNTARATHYIESGANINTRDENGDTALLRAVKSGDTPMALMLIDKKASLDLQDNNGATALIIACQKMEDGAPKGDIVLTQALLNANADLNIIDRNGKNAFQYAMLTVNVELVQLFEAPMMRALQRIPASDLAQALRSSDMNLDQVDPATGETALTMAAGHKGQETLAQAFIEAGANLDQRNSAGKTAVEVARDSNNAGMLKLLEEAQRNRSDFPHDRRPGTKSPFGGVTARG